MNTPTSPSLASLYRERSKHSSYQLVHPMLAPLLGDATDMPAGKLEVERQRYFARALSLQGASVLDIGANTGYFSYGAIERGAHRVRCYEGNAQHAQFIRTSADRLGLGERIDVRHAYFDFTGDESEVFDVCLCLNVVHHLGDDFGDAALSLDEARSHMLACVNRMAATVRVLMLQVGFNWKGDVRTPLFAGGQKSALIEFVQRGVEGHWSVGEIVVPDPATRDYEAVNAANIARNDAIGEFMNRPIFKLRSLQLD